MWWNNTKIGKLNIKNNGKMSNVNTFKDIVLEFLSFLHFKVNNDLLTMEEIESMARVMEENLTVVGTAEDLSRFYNQR